MRRRSLLLALLACLPAGVAVGAGNLQLTDAQGNLVRDAAGNAIDIRWRLDAMPTPGRIPWDLSALGDPDGVLSTVEIEAILTAAFHAWEAVPVANVAFIANCTRCANNHGTAMSGFDGDNLITFTDPDSDLIFQPGLVAVAPSFALVSTTTLGNVNDNKVEYVEFGGLDGVPDMREGVYPPGTILDADILFHPDVVFVNGIGELARGQLDLQSVATHELGHFIGLMHSAVGEAIGTRRADQATMYPLLHEDAAVVRTLEPDDIAAVGQLYPAPAFGQLGSISGTVRDSVRPIVAIVTALPVTGDDQTGSDAIFAVSDDRGRYTLPGLAPGSYVVGVQPFTQSSGPLWNRRYNATALLATNFAFPHEFYNIGESFTDNPAAYTVLTLAAGQRRAGVDIHVNALSSVADVYEINDTAQQAAAIAPNTIAGLYGVIAHGQDRDHFRFAPGAHRAVVVRVDADSFGSPLDAVVALRDGATGELLAFSDDRFYINGAETVVQSKDPLITVEDLPARPPESTLVVEIAAKGQASSGPYRLAVQTADRLRLVLGDSDGDGTVTAADLTALHAAPRRPDINADRRGDYRDLFRLQQEWQR